jgi:Tfp pilus assembly protein FimT
MVSKPGFTVIEVMIILALIAIMLLFFIPKFKERQDKNSAWLLPSKATLCPFYHT